MDIPIKDIFPTAEEMSASLNTLWTPFLRQLFVCSGTFVVYFVTGLSFGTPTVLIPQMRRDANSTAAVSDDMVTWLSSAHSYSAMLAVFILSLLVRLMGRKRPFIFVCLCALTGFIVYCTATTVTHVIISEIIMGMLFASNMTVSIMIVSEYTSPQYRGLFLTLKSATFFWGVWAANAIGTFYYWKNIGKLALGCIFYTLTALFWPESPHWLASQGRFDECIASHRWLRGTDKESERELEDLINSQKDYIRNSERNKAPALRDKLYNTVKIILSKPFYKPVLLSAAIMAAYHASGKLVCAMYATQLLKKIMQSESTAYISMLILDGVTVLGMYFGCAMSKFLKRRTLLLSSSSLGIIFLYLIALYLYLVELSVIVENNIIPIFLLTSFSVTISCGLMIMASSIYGELIPLRYKNIGSVVIVLISNTLLATLLKISPFIFKTFDLHGTFLFFALTSSLLTFLIYKYLPETKDKTLQEIEKYFHKNVQNEIQEEAKELMFMRTNNVKTP